MWYDCQLVNKIVTTLHKRPNDTEINKYRSPYGDFLEDELMCCEVKMRHPQSFESIKMLNNP